jgi:hypothetical protein
MFIAVSSLSPSVLSSTMLSVVVDADVAVTISMLRRAVLLAFGGTKTLNLVAPSPTA